MGGVRENEDWTFTWTPARTTRYSAIPTRQSSRRGLNFQRSQNSGQFMSQPGPVGVVLQTARNRLSMRRQGRRAFSTGSTTTIPGIYKALRKPAPAGADAALQAIDRAVASAVQSFRMIDPSAAAPALARALAATREAQRQLGGDPDVALSPHGQGRAAPGRDRLRPWASRSPPWRSRLRHAAPNGAGRPVCPARHDDAGCSRSIFRGPHDIRQSRSRSMSQACRSRSPDGAAGRPADKTPARRLAGGTATRRCRPRSASLCRPTRL